MHNIGKHIIELEKIRKIDPDYSDLENMFLDYKCNEDYLYTYIEKILLLYVNDKKEILNSIQAMDLINPSVEAGVYENNKKELVCIIPKVANLLDEIIIVHELTHLINIKGAKNNSQYLAKEIVPFFNEYDYLAHKDKKLKEEYEKYRLYNSLLETERFFLTNLRNILNNYIYAYFVLMKRKNDYNILRLNKMNANEKHLGISLEKAGYKL